MVKFIRAGIAFALIFILLYLADVRALILALKNLTLESVGLLLLLSILLIYVSALKWKLFLEALGSKVSVYRLFNLYLVGYFVNLLLPSYVGGDVVRSYYVGKEVGQHEALSATILERYTGLVAMLTLGVIFMWSAEYVTFEMKVATLVICLGVVVLTVVSLSAKTLSLLALLPRSSVILKHIDKIQAGLLFAKGKPSLILKSLLLSFGYHSLTVVNTMVAAYAVGWSDPPMQELFAVLPLILLLGAIPISPNGLGIQEGAFFYFLHAVGATPAEALGVALVLRAKSYVLAIFGWGVWLRVRRGVTGDSRRQSITNVQT